MRTETRQMDGVDNQFCAPACLAFSYPHDPDWSSAYFALLYERRKRANRFLANSIHHDYVPDLYWLALFKNTLSKHEFEQK